MKKKQLLLHALTALATLGALVLLYRSLRQYSRDDIVESLQALPWSNLGLAVLFCAGSYLSLGLFDALAVRYAGKPLALRRTALASFCGLSIGHTIGLAALSSGAVRYRFYSRWGLTTEEIAKVIGFCGVTVGLGLAALAGIALVLRPQATAPLGMGEGAALALGIACLACSAAYLVASVFLRGSVKLWRWRVEMPGFRLALGQLLVGTVNFVCVAACLHQLMRAYGAIGFLDVTTAYVTGNVATLITHVPGGIGVLEATVMHLVGEQKAIGALIAFRVIYFLIPLAIGLPTFLGSEVYFRGREPESDKAPNRREATMPS
ncbi:MAG: hypothetical protein BGO05_00325 [Rhizobiales bacterium 63-7]|nr:UPF0104 family protein [Hyphomicrobiales bacterium]OJU72199.1 MAG: hypothetical protein BGO05_00325 [Rhizobiales bacterium 63-7]